MSRRRSGRYYGRFNNWRPRSVTNYRSPRQYTTNYQQSSSFGHGDLENVILRTLYESFPHGVPFFKIKNEVPIKYNKKDINQILYSSMRNGFVRKSVENPPKWELLSEGKDLYEGRRISTTSRNPCHGDMKRSYPGDNQSHDVISYMRNNPRDIPCTSERSTSHSTINQNLSRSLDDSPGSSLGVGLIKTANLSLKKEIYNESYENKVSLMEFDDRIYVKRERIGDSSFVGTSCHTSGLKSSHADPAMKVELMNHDDLPPPLVAKPSDSPPPLCPSRKSEGNFPSKNQTSGGALHDHVLQILYSNKHLSVHNLVDWFKGTYSKQQLNNVLYSMDRNGLAKKSMEKPPKWQLLNKGKEKYEGKEKMSNGELSSMRKVSMATDEDTSAGYHVRRKKISRQISSTSQASDLAFSCPNSCSNVEEQLPVDCVTKMENVSIANKSNDQTDSTEPFFQASYYLSSPQENEYYGPPCKIQRREVGNPGKDESSKNPVSLINEYAQANNYSIDFLFEEEGPDHQKRFKCVLILNQKSFPAVEGTSKKLSKTKAAESALNIMQKSHPIKQIAQISQVNRAFQSAIVPGNSSKNAISFINEFAQANNQKIDFDCKIFGLDHQRRFSTTLVIGDKIFGAVEGSSKKDSKLKAAEAALVVLQSTGQIGSLLFEPPSEKHAIKTFHDSVAMMVNQKFNSLLMDLPDTIVGRKILAGFVMSRKVKMEIGDEVQWSVISIGSGNRCVAGDKLSMKGDTVNDNHAEIIARRGLLRYLYRQLLAYKENRENDENILTSGNDDADTRLILKKGITFHLYISTAPCGDSALFAKSDLRLGDQHDTDDRHHPLFENKKQGILRTKVENGEGCIPIEDDANVPTWDGLLRGERLRTMSCSDKIAKWNFLGLQGSLLSHFIKPVYMTSLTLGMLYHHGHLTRAVCCRLDRYLKNLSSYKTVSPLYKVHHPIVGTVSGDERSRDTAKIKTREFSLNWSVDDEGAEVLDGTQGRCEARYGCTNPVSQVSKSSLYEAFNMLQNKRFASYAKAKEAAQDYKAASCAMKEAFENAGCGRWMNKPTEEDDF